MKTKSDNFTLQVDESKEVETLNFTVADISVTGLSTSEVKFYKKTTPESDWFQLLDAEDVNPFTVDTSSNVENIGCSIKAEVVGGSDSDVKIHITLKDA